MADHPYLYLLERRIEDIDAQIALLITRRNAVVAELARLRTSDPGRSIAPKEETMNPQHQDEARER